MQAPGDAVSPPVDLATVQPPSPPPRPEAPPPPRQRTLVMPKVASLSTDIRTLVFNLFVLLLVGILAPVLLGQFWRNEVIVEPVVVPAQLQTMGLTPEVASARLVDALREVDDAGGTTIDAINVIASTDRVDFSIPDSGLSIDSLVYYVRRFFRVEETRIGGEFRCGDPQCTPAQVSLRLRVSSGQAHVIQVKPMQGASEDQYFYDAALQVMEAFRPIIAVAAIIDTQPVRAEYMARTLIRSRSADAAWAHNLLGMIKADAGEFDLAVEEFTSALAMDRRFVAARTNLGDALLQQGKLAEARAMFEQAQRDAPTEVRAVEGLADIAAQEHDTAAALALYRKATELDPTSPDYLIKAAAMQLATMDDAGAVASLEEALQIAPGNTEALTRLGLLHFSKNEYVEAVPYYRNAADFVPDNAEFQYQAGHSMLLAGDSQSALERLRIAVRLAPDIVYYKLDLVDALNNLKLYEEANTVIEAAARLAPDDWLVLYRQAINSQNLDRIPEAIALFKRVAQMAPQAPEGMLSARFAEMLQEQLTRDGSAPAVSAEASQPADQP